MKYLFNIYLISILYNLLIQLELSNNQYSVFHNFIDPSFFAGNQVNHHLDCAIFKWFRNPAEHRGSVGFRPNHSYLNPGTHYAHHIEMSQPTFKPFLRSWENYLHSIQFLNWIGAKYINQCTAIFKFHGEVKIVSC